MRFNICCVIFIHLEFSLNHIVFYQLQMMTSTLCSKNEKITKEMHAEYIVVFLPQVFVINLETMHFLSFLFKVG